MGRQIKVGTKYRHFKGHIVDVMCIAKHTETEEDMVVYKRLSTGEIWTRPLAMFTSEVDHEKYPEVTQRYRFEEIGMYEYSAEAAKRLEDMYVEKIKTKKGKEVQQQ